MPVEGLPWLRSGSWGMAVGCGLLRTQLQLHPCPTHQLLRLRLCLQELIVDPKSFSTPANLEAAPGSQPNPLLAHGSAASSSSSSSMSAAAAGAAGGGGSAPGSAPGSARAAAAAAAAEAELQRLALSQDDHPLSTSSSSKWQSYFKVGVSWCRGHRHGESLRSASCTMLCYGLQRCHAALLRGAVGAAPTASAPFLALADVPLPMCRCYSAPACFPQDVEVQEQIERDVARTHPDMHFFSGGPPAACCCNTCLPVPLFRGTPWQRICLPCLAGVQHNVNTSLLCPHRLAALSTHPAFGAGPSGAAAEHRRQMRRALFVFAKLNPGLRYVQVRQGGKKCGGGGG